jgi:uncharacterized membrane-anchored protein
VDIAPFLEAYGLPGAMIFGLALAVKALWTQYAAAQDARIADARESAREQAQIIREFSNALNGLTRVVEGLRNNA